MNYSTDYRVLTPTTVTAMAQQAQSHPPAIKGASIMPPPPFGAYAATKENHHSNVHHLPTSYSYNSIIPPALVAPPSLSIAIPIPAIARYAHPHSPNRTHVSSFQTNSPRPGTSEGYVSALSSPLLTALNAFPPASPKLQSTRPALVTGTQPQSYHRPTASGHANEPTMVQLLAAEPKSMGGAYRNRAGDKDASMATGVVSWRKGQGFKEWEKVRLESAEVKRKADVAQLCESTTEMQRRGTDDRGRLL
jgi:hypothetical protein